ncbi:hypothetical protein LZ30DRAFT_92601 [Colletotrichum cereale]|nr:hypothetical protein LZ30DRAFT_92601 [Colletotrichum cereale]
MQCTPEITRRETSIQRDSAVDNRRATSAVRRRAPPLPESFDDFVNIGRCCLLFGTKCSHAGSIGPNHRTQRVAHILDVLASFEFQAVAAAFSVTGTPHIGLALRTAPNPIADGDGENARRCYYPRYSCRSSVRNWGDGDSATPRPPSQVRTKPLTGSKHFHVWCIGCVIGPKSSKRQCLVRISGLTYNECPNFTQPFCFTALKLLNESRTTVPTKALAIRRHTTSRFPPSRGFST